MRSRYGCGAVRRPATVRDQCRATDVGLLRAPVAQQFARRSVSALAFRKRLNSVDDNGTIPLGALHATPFAAWQIVHDLADPVGFDAKPVHVIDYDVSPRAFA